MKKFGFAGALLIFCALLGCGKKELKGTYKQTFRDGSVMSLTFIPGHACQYHSPANGGTYGGTYQIEDKTLIADLGIDKMICKIIDSETLTTEKDGQVFTLKRSDEQLAVAAAKDALSNPDSAQSNSAVQKSTVASGDSWIEVNGTRYPLPRAAVKACHSSKGNQTMICLATYISALQAFRTEKGRFPSTSESLEILIGGASPYVGGTEIDKDGWNQPLRYQSPSPTSDREFELSSDGPDGKHGTDDDITQEVILLGRPLAEWSLRNRVTISFSE